MINVQYIFLKYVMLYASFCGNLFILNTRFVNLKCNCPQGTSKLVTTFPFDWANVPNMLLKYIFRRWPYIM